MILALVEGSASWQRGMGIAAAILLLWQAIRGWSLGPARQLVQIAALLAAYLAAVLLGGALLPLLRPVIQLPDILLRALGGVAAGLTVYLLLVGLGALVLKRTDQQPGVILRTIYGIAGSLLGLVMGCLLLWILLMGVRLVGTVAEARLEAVPTVASDGGGPEAYTDPDREDGAAEPLASGLGGPLPLLEFAVRAKRSVELGGVQPVVEAVDVIPEEVYALLGDLARVVATPETAARFLEYPGAAELAKHAKIRALQGDAEIAELLERRAYLALLRNEKVIEAANDPGIADRLRRFELRKAMDYALSAGPAHRSEGFQSPARSGSAGGRAVSSPVPSPRPFR